MLRPPVVLAAAVVPAVVAAPSPAPAAEAPPLVEVCTTRTLSVAEVQAGVLSDIDCSWMTEGQWASRSTRASYVAVHFDGTGGIGSGLLVSGSCEGGISMGPGDPWDDRISSTGHRSCGVVKHFANVDYTGGPQVTNGGYGLTVTLNGFLSDQVSSIMYAD